MSNYFNEQRDLFFRKIQSKLTEFLPNIFFQGQNKCPATSASGTQTDAARLRSSLPRRNPDEQPSGSWWRGENTKRERERSSSGNTRITGRQGESAYIYIFIFFFLLLFFFSGGKPAAEVRSWAAVGGGVDEREPQGFLFFSTRSVQEHRMPMTSPPTTTTTTAADLNTQPFCALFFPLPSDSSWDEWTRLSEFKFFFNLIFKKIWTKKFKL